MEQTELDLRGLLLVFRRRWKLLVALPVLAGLAAGIISYFFMTPIYKATATLWVIKENAGEITYNDVLMSRNLTKTYAQVAKSRVVMDDVINRLDLKGVTPEDLQRKLTVTAVNDTEILSFAVEDPDPTVAAKIANAVAAAFQRQISGIMQVENVALVDSARVPSAPEKPQPRLNVAIAVLLGSVAAVGFAFLAEYLDTSVKSSEDLTRHIGLPVLAVIPTFETQVRTYRSNRRNSRKDRKEASV